MSEISIHKVVSHLKSSIDNDNISFRIKARYVQGNRKGMVFVKNQARWYQPVRYNSRRSTTRTIERKSSYSNDSLMLYDVVEQRPFYVRRWAIIEFENQTVVHE